MFLPFTPNGKETERTAIEVKGELGLGPYAPVNPFEVLPNVPARLVDPDILPNEIRHVLLRRGRSAWSAVGFGPSPIDEHELILLNPAHHEHRRRASLMEELVHIVLEHPRVALQFNGGPWQRPFESDVEDEAFNVGAACIIPYRPLFNAIRHQELGADEIAGEYDVSVEYVRFRIKRSGLYHVYQKTRSE